MKKLTILLLGIILFSLSCQKRNHIQRIPAPHYAHFNSQSAAPVLSSPQEVNSIEQQSEASLQTDSEVPTAATYSDLGVISTPQKEIYAFNKKNTTLPTLVATQKPSFKEKIATKIIARKIQKTTGSKRPQADSINTMALLAGIFGILSIVLFWLTIFLGILFAAASIVLGFIGKKQINEGNGTGRGWAITGIALGFVTLLITAIFAIIIVALL